MSALTDLAGAIPPNTGMRVGWAELDTDGVTIIIKVANKQIDCGFLNTTVTAGQPVALLRSGPSWLCLGQIQVQP